VHIKRKNAHNNVMIKKIIIGLIAGVITGLFGAGGRHDTCSSIYIYPKTSEKKNQEQHLYFVYSQWYVQARFFT